MELGSELSPGDPGVEGDRLGAGGSCGELVPLSNPLELSGDPFELFPVRNKFAGSSAAIHGESQLRLCIDATTGTLLEAVVSARALGVVVESTGVLILGFGWEDGL